MLCSILSKKEYIRGDSLSQVQVVSNIEGLCIPFSGMTKRYVSRISIAIETIVSVTMVGLKGVVTRLLTFKCPSCDFSLM